MTLQKNERFHFSNVLDFYLLEAMRIAPVRFGNRAQERVVSKAERLHTELSETIAKVFFDYIFIACMGEARHVFKGQGGAETMIFDGIPNVDGRGHAYHYALEYDPKHALPRLAETFGGPGWDGSFGGERWANMARTAMLYYELPPPAFVDLVVDLKHNGGMAFSKSEALNMLGMVHTNFKIGPMPFTAFLTWKAEHDILSHHPPIVSPELGYFTTLPVASKVYHVMRSWYRVFKDRDTPSWYRSAPRQWPNRERLGIETYGTKQFGKGLTNYVRSTYTLLEEYKGGKPIDVEKSEKLYTNPITSKELSDLEAEYLSQGEQFYLI